MKHLIFGASGYVGARLAQYCQEQGDEVVVERVDVLNSQAVSDHIKKHMPDRIWNAAGVTGTPNVDWCETHVSETLAVNVGGALHVALAAQALGIHCTQMSSGCVYDGDGMYTEEDEQNYEGSVYSYSKKYAEKLLLPLDQLILRIRMPIDATAHSKNTLNKLLKYERVISVKNSFTVMEDFIPAAYQLGVEGHTGIFNMTNPGAVDHKYILDAYTKIVDEKKAFSYISLDELFSLGLATAPRSNATLNTEKRESLGVSMPPIEGRILSLLETYKKNMEL